jgi:oligo-1,6-glucosidase
VHSAKMLAIWLAAQSGTLFLYQGQEIGMINAPAEWDIDTEYHDVESSNYWAEAVRLDDSGIESGRKERIAKGLRLMARDHARLPFQWDGSAYAGFSTAKPWMRAHDSSPEINVEAQEHDANSVLSFYKKMLGLRKTHRDVFVYGRFEVLDLENENTFVYRKRYEERIAVVVLNFTTEVQGLPDRVVDDMEVLVSSYGKVETEALQPLEGRVYVNY